MAVIQREIAGSSRSRSLFPRSEEPYKSTATYRPEDQHWGVIAAACNHPNCLVLPFRLELIRLAA